jgi:hypothetical protein
MLCLVLGCQPTDLLICEPEKVAARKPAKTAEATTGRQAVKPRLGRHRSEPPA